MIPWCTMACNAHTEHGPGTGIWDTLSTGATWHIPKNVSPRATNSALNGLLLLRQLKIITAMVLLSTLDSRNREVLTNTWIICKSLRHLVCCCWPPPLQKAEALFPQSLLLCMTTPFLKLCSLHPQKSSVLSLEISIISTKPHILTTNQCGKLLQHKIKK